MTWSVGGEPAVASLDEAEASCAPSARPGAFDPAPFKYLVVLSDNDPATVARVLDVAHFGVVYRSAPVIETNGPPDLPDRLAALDGVRYVLAPMAMADGTRPVAAALDYLGSLAGILGSNPAEILTDNAGQPVGYPVVTSTEGQIRHAMDPGLVLPVRSVQMPVVGMSLGPAAVDYPFAMHDVVNIVTAANSSHQLVVAAAGNCGDRGDGISAWARPEWVLAVGASDDEPGTRLASYSSRGVPDQPGTGPDLVAWGRSAVPPHPTGTSFAAPRVVGYALICAAAMLQLRQCIEEANGHRQGVPLVGAGLVDSFGQRIWWSSFERATLPALPLLGPDRAAVAEAVHLAASAGVAFEVVDSPRLLRHLLLSSTRPMPGYAPHEVGGGFVDRPAVEATITRLTAAHVAAWAATGPVDQALLDRLGELRLFDPEQVTHLAKVVLASFPEWRYDWRTHRTAWLPESGGLPELSEDERRRGVAMPWPPPVER